VQPITIRVKKVIEDRLLTNAKPDSSLADLFAFVPYLTELDSSATAVIASSLIPLRYETDEIIFVEGEPCAGLYVIQTGWVKAVKSSLDGREQVLDFVGPGEAFNTYGVFASDTNPASAIALEPTSLYLIPRATLLRLLETHPALARMVIQDLARRVQHLLSLVEDLSLRTVESRLARYLLQTATGDILWRQRWATQAEIAARLGTVPDVLNRAFRDLAEDGLISIDRQRIVILNREALENRAGLEP